MKINKSVSIKPGLVVEVEELIDAGRVSSFSFIAEKGIAYMIHEYKKQIK